MNYGLKQDVLLPMSHKRIKIASSNFLYDSFGDFKC